MRKPRLKPQRKKSENVIFALMFLISINALSGFTLMMSSMTSILVFNSCRSLAQDEQSSAVTAVALINLIRLIGLVFV